jgi:hypothetical protein
MVDRCRPEQVTVDGRETTVVVHGSRPMDDTDRGALGQLVAAVQDHMRAKPRWRAIEVLLEHQRDGGRCRCGESARREQQHAAHLVDQLIEACLIDATTALGGAEDG